MVRRGGRSKACASCRRAKKKCDEVYPHCGPCTAANRPCPGAIQGNIFVNADISTIVSSNAVGHTAPTSTNNTNKISRDQRDATVREMNCRSVCQRRKGSTSSIGRRTNGSHILSNAWKEFHSVPLHDIQVISNLVRYYTLSGRGHRCTGQDRQSWLVRLPDLLQQNLSIRMRAPLLAPALVLIALQSKQPDVLKEALKWYDRGLGYLRTRLKHLENNMTDETDDNFLICAALFMSIYETLQTTVVGGYEQHVLGAVTLLQVKGPDLFARPDYHDLFLAIRGHAIHVSLMTGKPTCLANEEWLSIPFSQQTKSKSEMINDILLLIPRYLHELQTELSYISDVFERDSAKQKFMQRMGSLKKDLGEIQSHIYQSLKPVHSRESSTSASADEDSADHDASYKFTNPMQAKIVAMQACARVIILGILSATTISTSCTWPCFFPIETWHDGNLTIEIVEASKQIISASRYLSRFTIGCAYLRMILPLQLVGQMSPNLDQRVAARNILESWCNDTPIKGLTALALQALKR